MAINNTEKRRQATGITLTVFNGVTPDISKDEPWRTQVANGWSFVAGENLSDLFTRLLVFLFRRRRRS